MPELRFHLVVETDGAKEKIRLVKADAEELRGTVEQPSNLNVSTAESGDNIKRTKKDAEELRGTVEKPSRLYIVTTDADGKLKLTKYDADKLRDSVEKPSNLHVLTTDARGKLKLVKYDAEEASSEIEKKKTFNVDANQALASIRDLTIALAGVAQAVSKVVDGVNELLESAHTRHRSVILAQQAFGDAADEMRRFASEMQSLTNFKDDKLLALMAKMSAAFKLSTEEIQALTPHLLDFAEAFSSTGLTVESAFNLMGRALNGHTEMLGRHGVELDKTRLQTEGVSYLIEELGSRYGGTAQALAELRLQNRNTWADVKETVGGMLERVFNPLLKGLKAVMDAFNSWPPIMQGIVAGITLAIPVIVSLTATITALTAAVAALKTAINPIVGIISLVAGAATAGVVAWGSYAAATKEAKANTTSLGTTIRQCGDQVQQESTKFSLLANRLLDLKAKTSLTNKEKAEMKSLITQLNNQYGEYLGNINMETASYDALARALQGASQALVQKKVAEVYGEQYQAMIDRVAKLQIEINKLNKELSPTLSDKLEKFRDALVYEEDKGKLEDAIDIREEYWAKRNAEWNKQRLEQLKKQLEQAKYELNKFGEAYRDALANVPDITGTGAPKADSALASKLDSQLNEFQRLLEGLETASLDAFERHRAEYERRAEIILKYASDGSVDTQRAMELLTAWDVEAVQKLQEAERDATQKLYAEKVDYYANLNSLGVDSYDQLKAATEEYYEWAKANLPEKERVLVLAQLRQVNLRWGQHRKEQLEKEAAHQRELADLRDQFTIRGYELTGNTYAAQLRAIDNYYAQRKDKLIEAGLTEVEIERQKELAIANLKQEVALSTAQGLSGIFANLAEAQDQETERGFKAWKAMSIAQGYIDTFSAAIGAYKAMVGIPVVGPGLAVAAAAAALTAGIANIGRIAAQKYEKREAGGLLHGPSHREGGTIIEAEGGEYIINKATVRALGSRFFDALNFAPIASLRSALAGLRLPAIPLPATMPAFAYASGGPVSTGAFETLNANISRLVEALAHPVAPVVNVTVDPLSNDPVKVSQIAERGTKMRATY